MAVLRQGGSNPHAGKVMTTTGPKEFRRRCMSCGEYKEDGLFTLNGYGQAVCPACASPRHRRVLDTVTHRMDCEDGLCGCVDREPEDGKVDDSTLPDD